MIEHVNAAHTIDIQIILSNAIASKPIVQQRLRNILGRIVNNVISAHSPYKICVPAAADTCHVAVIQLLRHCLLESAHLSTGRTANGTRL